MRQVLFYDPKDLGEAAQGLRNPWEVLPYTIWRPEPFYMRDPVGQRIFMIERGLGTENAAVVHVWTYQVTPVTMPWIFFLLGNTLGMDRPPSIPVPAEYPKEVIDFEAFLPFLFWPYSSFLP